MHARKWYVVAAVVGLFVAASQLVVRAQTCGVVEQCTPPPNTPEPTLTEPPPGATERPSPTPTAKPEPEPSELPEVPGVSPTPKPKKTTSPKSTPTVSPGQQGDDGKLPDALQQGFDIPIPDIPRTLPNNTTKLVRLLTPLTETGLPLEEVLIEGMGRFPVAGLAYWSDDWLMPRFSPVPHLHHGLDMFADFGTPARAVDNGTIAFEDDPDGWGITVFLDTSDGTRFVYGHLEARAEDLQPGDDVKIGDVVGYVGNSGNAQGGAPHLHFEIRRPEPIPPKPEVDRWLHEAERNAPAFVEMRRREILGIKGGDVRIPRSDAKRVAQADGALDASMLLTLLDPVGGSVGLLPRLELERTKRHNISDQLLAQLIRNRVGGYLFAPSSAVGHAAD